MKIIEQIEIINKISISVEIETKFWQTEKGQENLELPLRFSTWALLATPLHNRTPLSIKSKNLNFVHRESISKMFILNINKTIVHFFYIYVNNIDT